MELNLKNKNAIITGGASGFGKQLAIDLAKEGANIIIADISIENAKKVSEELISKYNVKSFAIKTDLSNHDDTINLIKESETKFSNLDILVNNAGFWPTNNVVDTPVEEWIKTFDINLTSVFLTCREFAKHVLNRNGKGKILNITSQAAFNGSTTGHAHYAASKSGVVTFTISLSREIARMGVNVNAMAIGMMNSPMTKKAIEKNGEYYLNRIPIGKIAEPSDLTPMAVFLVSDASNYYTGATFDVSGGMITR